MHRYFPPERRRRLAPLVLVGGLFTVGKLAYDEVPRDQRVRFVLPEHAIDAMRVTYSSQNEFYGGLERRFPNGSPRELDHTPQLSPGSYRLSIELTAPGGAVTHLTRQLTVPSEGVTRIRLTESD
jgi:hypothetical protein